MKQTSRRCEACSSPLPLSQAARAEGRASPRPGVRFCSRKCAASLRRVADRPRQPTPDRTCRACSVPFAPKTPTQAYCSPACRSSTCPTCGTTFDRLERPKMYCSTKCQPRRGSNTPRPIRDLDVNARRSQAIRESKTGPKNPNWRGGRRKMPPTPGQTAVAHRLREGRCRRCGTSRGLCLHHVAPVRMWGTPQEAHLPANTVTLCRRCHPRVDSALRAAEDSGSLALDLPFGDQLPLSIRVQLRTGDFPLRLPRSLRPLAGLPAR